MKDNKNRILTIHKISYYVFIFLIIIIPLALYRGFDNGLEFVKSEALKIIGGVFIIACSAYLVLNYGEKKSAGNKILFDKAFDPFVIFFIISAVLSALFSIDIYVSFSGSYERQIGLLIYLYLFLIYMLLPLVINNNKRFRTTFLVMEAAAVLVALMCILEYTSLGIIDIRPQGFKRPVSTIGHPIFSAGFMVMVFPFSLLNISAKKSKIFKIAVPIVIAAGIISTQTRTAYIAVGAEIIVIFALYFLSLKEKLVKEKKKYIALLFLFLSAVLVFVAVSILFPESAFVKRVLSIAKIYDQPRWLLWRDSILMFIHYPFTGTGIGTFSRAFENFASYELRYSEIRVYFDNAHNNFINTFCTMGIIGGIAYILVLFRVFSVSLKNLLSRSISSSFRVYSLAFLSFISGYTVYGLADFDDINILFYFFFLLSLYKAGSIIYANRGTSFRELHPGKKIIYSVPGIIILFSLYNFYTSYNEISAQISFSKGVELYSSGDISGFIKSMNTAISLNPNEPYYRYEFASKLNIYSSGLSRNDSKTKNMLLETAKNEVIKAEINHSSRINCMALLSLIELGLGNEKEAFRIKNEMYKIDSTVISYRINLAVYYLNQNNYEFAINEINTVLLWDIKNINAFTAKVMYFLRTGDNVNAEKTCMEILSIEPGNSFAERTLKELDARNKY